MDISFTESVLSFWARSEVVKSCVNFFRDNVRPRLAARVLMDFHEILYREILLKPV